MRPSLNDGGLLGYISVHLDLLWQSLGGPGRIVPFWNTILFWTGFPFWTSTPLWNVVLFKLLEHRTALPGSTANLI
jgi:hypothetical protein